MARKGLNSKHLFDASSEEPKHPHSDDEEKESEYEEPQHPHSHSEDKESEEESKGSDNEEKKKEHEQPQHPHTDDEESRDSDDEKSEESKGSDDEESGKAETEEEEESPPAQTLLKYDSHTHSKTLNLPKSKDVGVGDSKKSSKRPAPDTHQLVNASRGKKIKTDNRDDDVVEDKKLGIGKLWSENDEIALLQGMIDYKSETGSDPNSNLSLFLDFVNDSLSVRGSKVRLSEKMRRLKKKYKQNAQNWNDKVFALPHEHKLYVLSNRIWGGQTEVNDTKVKRSRKKKHDGFANKSQVKNEEDEDGKTADLLSLFPRLSNAIELEASTCLIVPKDTKEYAKEIISSFGKEKARELEEGWKAIRVMECELYARRAEMKVKQTQAMLDAVMPSES